MQNENTDGSGHKSLKKMVNYCHDIKVLLKNDTEHFSNNDISKIEVSNKSKMELIDKLNLLTHELDGYYLNNQAGSILERIEKESGDKGDVQNTLAELKTEIANCYQYIMTNSSIVFSNLHHLKRIWDNLLAASPNMDCVYDQSGNTKNR